MIGRGTARPFSLLATLALFGGCADAAAVATGPADAADGEVETTSSSMDAAPEQAAASDGTAADAALVETSAPEMDASDATAERGGEDGGSEAGEPTVNDCSGSLYVDATDASALRHLTWDILIAMAPERCTKIAAGQAIEFVGDFIDHPMHAEGGDANSPIPDIDGGDSLTVVFTTPGIFGFVCGAHPEMRGAIKVTP